MGLGNDPRVDVTLQRSETGHVVVVSFEGSLDTSTAPRLQEALTSDALAPGTTLVVVELSGCTFLDTAAVSALIEGALRARDAGAELITINARPDVARVLTLSGVDGVVGLSAARDRYKHGSVLFPPQDE
jgi:anti-sigma B factor antagonist